MDSTWFAVDEVGEIGFFDPGEGGAIPSEGFPLGGEAGARGGGLEASDVAFPLLQELARDDPSLLAAMPEDVSQLGAWWSDDPGVAYRVLLSLGIHVYACGESDGCPYVRVALPSEPRTTLGQLPPDASSCFAPGKLPVRFAEQERLAPGIYVPVEPASGSWSDMPDSPRAELDQVGTLEEASVLAPGECPAGVPEPSAEYWQGMRPLHRAELIQCLRDARESFQRQEAERRAKGALVAARVRAHRAGLFGFLRRLFGDRR